MRDGSFPSPLAARLPGVLLSPLLLQHGIDHLADELLLGTRQLQYQGVRVVEDVQYQGVRVVEDA